MGQTAIIATRAIILRVHVEGEPRPNQVEPVSERMPYLIPCVS